MPSFTLTLGWEEEKPHPTPGHVLQHLSRLPQVESSSDYLIIERHDDQMPAPFLSFIQTRPMRVPHYEGLFLIEYRDGQIGRHFHTYIEAEVVGEILLSYLRDEESWREMALWRDISFQFEDLKKHLPAEEMAASFFEVGELEAVVKDRERRRTELDHIWAEAAAEPDDEEQPTR